MLQKIINQYNALHGKVSREKIVRLTRLIFDHLPQYPCLKLYYDKLDNLTNKYPDIEIFNIDLKTPAKCPTGLNGAFDIDTSLRIPEGLNKPINEDQYKIINEKILELISNKDLSYQKKWHTKRKHDAYILAYNFDTKKEYKGLYNQMMLGTILPQVEPLSNPYYLSKKQIEKHGGTIKKRHKIHYAFYYNVLYRVQFDDAFKLDFKTYDRNEMRKYLYKKQKQYPAFKKFVGKYADGNIEKFISFYCTIPFLKSYQVYNGSDIEGIDFKLDQFTGKGKIPATQTLYKPNKKIEIAESIIKSYPKPAPKIKRKEQDRAFYSPGNDTITMPLLRQFNSAQEFYGTLFHEMIHSTGHKNRLKRDFSGKFGSKAYAKEELIAEIGSSYLSATAGILHFNIKNTAAYLQSWGKALTKNIKEDQQFIIRASQKAKKASDFILQNFDETLANNKPETVKKPVSKQAKPKTSAKPKKPKISNALNKPNQKKNEVEIKPDNALMSLTQLSDTNDNETFNIYGDIGKFLGNIERKPVASIAVTTDAPQGAGKTTFAFQKIDAFARAGNKVLFVSLEEHPESNIFKRKVKQYISPQASKNVFVLGELENGIETLKKYIPQFDAIFIDSWQKVVKEAREKNGKRIDFDYDFRKAFNGKYFDVIFQRTQDGKMRGGSEAQFDGDVILKIAKGDSFKENYVFYDKNRYMIDNYIWNISEQKLIKID